MSAKEYLLQIPRLEARIKSLELDNERMRGSLQGHAITYDSERVQTSPKDQMWETMPKVVENCGEITKIKSKIAKIKKQMRCMDKEKHAKILVLVYGNNKTLAEAAVLINRSYDRAKHIHREALDAFESKYL